LPCGYAKSARQPRLVRVLTHDRKI
jgi:hypothetical protein